MLFADAALARRIEGAESRMTHELAEAVRRRSPGRVFSALLGGGVAVHVGEPAPFNKLIGLGLSGPLTDPDWAQLDQVEAEFSRRETPVQAEVCTLADGSVFRALCDRGYVLVGFENVLGLRLQTAHPGAAHVEPARPLRGLQIAPITTADAAGERAWMDAVVTGFAHPDAVPGGPSHESFPRDAIERSMQDLVRLPGFVRYLGQIDDAIAGGAGLRIHQGVAQLCGSATLPTQRRRGMQSALLARRLADAAAAGCDIAVITTQPGSKSQENAQRSGFSLLYARAILLRSPTV
jgi:ribosomal protein S18 acetylase RimI-like enzyme